MVEIKHRFTNEVLYTIDADTLVGADFSDVELTCANFAGLDLTNATFTNTTLLGVDFENANLTNAILLRTKIYNAVVMAAEIDDSVFDSEDVNDELLFISRDSTDKILQNLVLVKSRCQGIILENAVLVGTHFQSTSLKDAVLCHADCNNTHFDSTVLDGADFYQAEFSSTIFNSCTGLGLTKNIDTCSHGSQCIVDVTSIRHAGAAPSHRLLLNSGYTQDEIDGLINNPDDIYLKLYVPEQRYQAEQVGSFVRLFEGYLNRVEKCPITVDTTKSGNGTCYIFKLPADLTTVPDLQISLNKFEAFLELCSHNPQEAERIIAGQGITPAQSSELVTKFTKQYKRLQTDARQEFESKRLTLSHALEAEFMELQMGGEVSRLEIIPARNLSATLFPVAGASNVTVNVMGGEQAKQVVDAITAKVYSDGIMYTDDERQLLKVIHENAKDDREAISLKSEMDLLKDDTADPKARRGAIRTITEFCQRNGQAMGEIAFKSILELAFKTATGG